MKYSDNFYLLERYKFKIDLKKFKNFCDFQLVPKSSLEGLPCKVCDVLEYMFKHFKSYCTYDDVDDDDYTKCCWW